MMKTYPFHVPSSPSIAILLVMSLKARLAQVSTSSNRAIQLFSPFWEKSVVFGWKKSVGMQSKHGYNRRRFSRMLLSSFPTLRFASAFGLATCFSYARFPPSYPSGLLLGGDVSQQVRCSAQGDRVYTSCRAKRSITMVCIGYANTM